jgi:hypothetical protein
MSRELPFRPFSTTMFVAGHPESLTRLRRLHLLFVMTNAYTDSHVLQGEHQLLSCRRGVIERGPWIWISKTGREAVPVTSLPSSTHGDARRFVALDQGSHILQMLVLSATARRAKALTVGLPEQPRGPAHPNCHNYPHTPHPTANIEQHPSSTNSQYPSRRRFILPSLSISNPLNPFRDEQHRLDVSLTHIIERDGAQRPACVIHLSIVAHRCAALPPPLRARTVQGQGESDGPEHARPD